MEKAMSFVKADDGAPLAVDIGFVLNHDNRFDLPFFTDEVDAKTVD